MMEHQQPTKPTSPTKRRTVLLICLIIAAAIALCAATGMICWQIRDRQAQAEVEETKLTHMENFNYSRTNAYRWVTEAWNRTLVDLYADVVFYGDSLTAGGAWGEWYPYWTCINLGVVGDTVDGLNSRIQQVEMLQPSKCFLMVGVNDLNYGMTVEMTLRFYEKLLGDLSALEESTGVTTYVLSVLPVREGEIIYPTTNGQIRQLNEGIAALAAQYGMPYVDLHALFADENGMLRQEYSYDGLHLTEAGYQVWLEAITPYVDEE